MQSFPHAEERESLETLRSALWGAGRDDPPLCHFIVARPPDDADAVAGFVCTEYYPRSRCGLLSYMAVDPGLRRGGIARTLFRDAIATLNADAAASGAELAAVFGEIHDPVKIDATGDPIAPSARVRIMDRLGARRVPIPYVQPELGEGRGRGRALMLVAFPTHAERIESLKSAVVRAFVQELYEALGVDRTEEDVDFARSLVGLRDETLDLETLVPVERPLLRDVTQYGIGIHLPLEPKEPSSSMRRSGQTPTASPSGNGRKADDESDPLYSFEEDMFAYAYPDQPPFSTRTVEVPDEWALVSAEFPAELTFASEGRQVSLRCADLDRDADGVVLARRTRRFLLRASRTDFRRSGTSVLHLVLGPDPGDPQASTLNEYDLIKLMKLWQPGEGLSHDGTDLSGEPFVRFRAGGRELTLSELAVKVFGEGSTPVTTEQPRAGTVQVLHECCRKKAEKNLCDEIDELLESEGAVQPTDRVKAVGGLVQGLLDFAEVDGDELADVFREVEREDELVRAFHKGTLIVVSASDRAFDAESVRVRVGLSPYLLVPHAVLLHNEWWLRDSVSSLDEVRRGHLLRLRTLEAARAHVASTLSQRLVPNVFNYSDERTLYERGRRARGLPRRQRSVEGRLAAITAEIRSGHERIRSGAAQVVAVIALVFTWSDALAKHNHTVVYAVLIPTTLLTLAALAFVFWRD